MAGGFGSENTKTVVFESIIETALAKEKGVSLT